MPTPTFADLLAEDETFGLLSAAIVKRAHEYAAEVTTEGGMVDGAAVTADETRHALVACVTDMFLHGDVTVVDVTDATFTGEVTVTMSEQAV